MFPIKYNLDLSFLENRSEKTFVLNALDLLARIEQNDIDFAFVDKSLRILRRDFEHITSADPVYGDMDDLVHMIQSYYVSAGSNTPVDILSLYNKLNDILFSLKTSTPPTK
jgi:hypothetical protein